MQAHIFLRLLISAAAVGIAVLRKVRPDIAIDATTLVLIGVAVLPWLYSIFRSIEVPGGLRVEFADLERAKKEVREAGLLPSATPLPSKTPSRREYAFEAVARDDPSLGLAGLRIEIERKVKELAASHGIPESRSGLARLLRDLGQSSVLTVTQVSALNDLLPMLNRAAHGAYVDPRAADWAVEVGRPLLASLSRVEREAVPDIPDLLRRWRRRDGAQVVEVGHELTEAAVRLPEDFLRAMAADPESFESWLQELQLHSFTVFDWSGPVQREVLTASHERLRHLLIAAMRKAATRSDLTPLAERAISAIERVDVHFVD